MRVAVSMRVDTIPDYAEVRDTLDQAWYRTLDELLPGSTVYPVPNHLGHARKLIHGMQPDAIVLSGGNDIAHLPGARGASPQRDEVERMLMQHARSRQLKLLGVCRGFQHMNLHLGGSVTACDGHVACTHRITSMDGVTVFCVNSYHDFAIADGDLAPVLEPLFRDDCGNIEAAVNPARRWLGIMWHPERPDPRGNEQTGRLASLIQEAWQC